GGKLYRMPLGGTVEELDPTTLAVVRTFQVPSHEQNDDPGLAADDSGHLYYRPDRFAIYRIDIGSGQVTKFVDLPWSEVITRIEWGFGSLWVTNFNADTVWRINTAM